MSEEQYKDYWLVEMKLQLVDLVELATAHGGFRRELSQFKKALKKVEKAIERGYIEPEYKYEKIGNKIKSLREKTGLSQEDFSKLVGVKKFNIENWEVGVCCPKEKTIEKLLIYAGITYKELIGEEGGK